QQLAGGVVEVAGPGAHLVVADAGEVCGLATCGVIGPDLAGRVDGGQQLALGTEHRLGLARDREACRLLAGPVVALYTPQAAHVRVVIEDGKRLSGTLREPGHNRRDGDQELDLPSGEVLEPHITGYSDSDDPALGDEQLEVLGTGARESQFGEGG